MSKTNFEVFLEALSPKPLTVLSPSISLKDFCFLDLSLQNEALKDVDVSSSDELETFIFNHIKSNNAKVAYGGYLESRGIYNRSDYFNETDPELERNIHLGLDLWLEANAPIFAPLDGIIHSFANNTNHGDYGPTLILEHKIKGQTFYTLYGHLSLASLQGKSEGQPITKGEAIATLGTADVNGDYPPHLHFQIIKDIKDYKGDYPGVSNLKDLEFYKENCPNPNLLLKLF
ncbi:peptidoglycan DD-metalloendopeptidase family protein [Winogradskyella maritima]|uniref:Peptidoglycan DD-metalloendopeptidase family protein n=1 Tax=Winogradskyella maritima TaxID=1517766 RepID=A0ABV8AIN8_9FLAO|nr:peptidoglycan DD-metalloendopeptidase family protein [Winogradskyella maritima]